MSEPHKRDVSDTYSITLADAVDTLNRALWKRQVFEQGQLPIIRSDNGPPFVSLTFESACEQLKVEHERIRPRTPNMNAHIESFHRLLEDDCLSRHFICAGLFERLS